MNYLQGSPSCRPQPNGGMPRCKLAVPKFSAPLLVTLAGGAGNNSSQNRFAVAFKEHGTASAADCGPAVSEGAKRLGISTKSRYTWKT